MACMTTTHIGMNHLLNMSASPSMEPHFCVGQGFTVGHIAYFTVCLGLNGNNRLL